MVSPLHKGKNTLTHCLKNVGSATDYWAVMERKSRFYREWERTDHSFGVTTPEKIAELKQLGKSWLTAVRWPLQEDRIWPPE